MGRGWGGVGRAQRAIVGLAIATLLSCSRTPLTPTRPASPPSSDVAPSAQPEASRAADDGPLVVWAASFVFPHPCTTSEGHPITCTPPAEIEIETPAAEALAVGTRLALVAEAGVVGTLEIIEPTDPAMRRYAGRGRAVAYGRLIASTRTAVALPVQRNPHESESEVRLFAVAPAVLDPRARVLPVREDDVGARIDLTGDGREDVRRIVRSEPAPALAAHQLCRESCEETEQLVGEAWAQTARSCTTECTLVGP